MTACQRDNLVSPDEGIAASKDAVLYTTDLNAFMEGPNDCRCRYEILDVVIDNEPTTGTGDHPEFLFYCIDQCSSTLSTTYFSAFIGECDDPLTMDPGTDYFPNGTTNTTIPGLGSPHFFNCDIPRFDIYDLDMDFMWWRPSNCTPNFSQLNGTITYRIICQDNAISNSYGCKPFSEYISNVMESDFTGGSGLADLDNNTHVKMGTRFYIDTNDEHVTSNGCGCEPYIEEY